MHCALYTVSTQSMHDGFEHEHLSLRDFVSDMLNCEVLMPDGKIQGLNRKCEVPTCLLPFFKTIQSSGS